MKLLKLDEVIGNTKKGINGRIPMGKTKWYQGIKTGVHPAPRKYGDSSYWVDKEVDDLAQKIANGELEAGI